MLGAAFAFTLCAVAAAVTPITPSAPATAPAPAPAPATSNTSSTTALCNTELYSQAVLENGRLVVRGTPVQYNGGNITTYIALKNDTGCGSPLAVGFVMQLNLTNMPAADEVSMQPPAQCKEDPYGPGCPPPTEDIPITFPQGGNASFSPFYWLGFNWQPIGHPPLSVFSVPHFDMHFWIAPEALKQEITPGTPPEVCTEGTAPETFTNAHMPIPQECFPDGIANLNAVAPYMGNHYINLQEPVIQASMNGTPNPAVWVDPSFIVGGWKGKTVFLEPMVRLTYMQAAEANQTRTCYTPTIPAQFSDASFYPTQFCIDATTPGSIYVEMDTFVQQKWPGCNSTDYAAMSYITAVPPPPNAEPLPDFCVAPLPKNMTTAEPPMEAATPAPAPTTKPSSPSPAPTPASWGTASSLSLGALLGSVIFHAVAGVF